MSDYENLVQEIASCVKCGLSRGRTRSVPGAGATDADIMFIGEGPGYYEDQRGVPFVGAAGNLLNEMLASIGLSRRDVYITNMIKCRPPNNRDPFPAEISACSGYLDRQIEMIDPKVIVALGRFSFAKFFPRETISRARGKPRLWNGLVVYPMYHPAAALHNPNLRPALERDFARLPGLIESVIQRQANAERTGLAPSPEPDGQISTLEEPSKQLSMFD